MNTRKTVLRFGAGPFVAGLFMIVFLAACAQVTVECPPAGGARGPDDGPAGCRPPVSYSSDAFGFYNIETRSNITDHTHTCNAGSYKCQAIPGNCYMGGPNCKNYFSPSSPGVMTGTCGCGCP
jgi:hypothetical protein